MSPTGTTKSNDPTLLRIEEACARNLPLELRQRVDSEYRVARSRFLGQDAENIFVDKPLSIDKPIQMSSDQIVEVFFSHNGTMYSFSTTWSTPQCLVKLNEQKMVVGAALKRPKAVQERQRRRFFRLSTLSVDPIMVELQESTPEEPYCSVVGGRRFRGTITNVSIGGMSVSVPSRHCPAMESHEKFFVAFRLPDYHEEMIFLAELRHKRSAGSGSSALLGLRFIQWDPATMEKQVEQINRFINEYQRRRMRVVRR